MEVRCYRVGRDEDAQALRESILRVSQRLLVQTIKCGKARNETFVKMIVEQTTAAASTNNLLARRKEVDLLLRLAGTSQISVALKTVGVVKGEPFELILAGEGGDVRAAEASSLVGKERILGAELGPADLGLIERAALLNALRA